MDLSNILIGDTTWSFVLEILVRCTIMFIIIISFLRLSGKRGIRQLSLFELAIILCLGSLCRSDRVSKYNQLLRIEELTKAVYRGKAEFKGLN